MRRKRKLEYIVEPQFCFAWSNLIDGEYVPKAPLRSEKPPGSCIWKASVYFQNANAAHLKGYKLQRTHNVNVLECSAGGLRPHLCQVQAPVPATPLFNLNPDGHTQTHLSKEAGDREASLAPKPCLPILLLYLKSFNGRHLHKVCRRLRCSACQMRATLRRVRGNNAKSPPPPLLSSAPFGTLPCPPLRGSKEWGGGDPGRLMCPLWSSSRHTE